MILLLRFPDALPSYRCGYRLLCIASTSFGPLRAFAVG